jgi:hypothetical protein
MSTAFAPLAMMPLVLALAGVAAQNSAASAIKSTAANFPGKNAAALEIL